MKIRYRKTWILLFMLSVELYPKSSAAIKSMTAYDWDGSDC